MGYSILCLLPSFGRFFVMFAVTKLLEDIILDSLFLESGYEFILAFASLFL